MSDGGFLSTVQRFLQEGVQSIFIFPRVFLLFVNDESGVAENAVSDGFEHALEGLDVDDFNQNIFTVFPG
jgi:hypothetical protein